MAADSAAVPLLRCKRLGLSWVLVVFLWPLLLQPVLASQASFDYYEVLGLGREATLADVRRAYRREALEWHPDKNPGRREEAEERFRRIAEAYAVLSNGDARHRYGRESRFSAGSGFSSGSAGESGGGAGRPGGSSAGRRQRSGAEGFKFEGVRFSFESAEDLFRQFFGEEDPFEEAKDQIRRGHEVMMDAIREGEAITTRLGDLLKTFAGEPDASGGASARAARRERERAERDRDRARRARERANAKREKPEWQSRTQDRQTRAEGRESLRDERAQRAEKRSRTQARDAFEKPPRRPHRDFRNKNKHREHPEFDFASVMDAGMRTFQSSFQSAFQDWRPDL